MRTTKNLMRLTLVFVLAGLPILIAAEKPPQRFEEQRKADAKRQEAETTRAKNLDVKEQAANVKLPEDTTALLKVKEIRFSGNTLISTTKLLAEMPVIFNASDKPLAKAESKYLYNFATLREAISTPGKTREISARTIQGLSFTVFSHTWPRRRRRGDPTAFLDTRGNRCGTTSTPTTSAHFSRPSTGDRKWRRSTIWEAGGTTAFLSLKPLHASKI